MPVVLRVYQRANPTTLIAELDQTYEVSWLDELAEVGGGELTIPHDSPVVAANPTLFDRGNIVRVEVDGVERFAWVVERKRRTLGDVWDPVQIAGPGIAEVLRFGTVYPEWGLDRPTPDQRIFGFMSRDYDDSAWTSAVVLGTQDDPPHSRWVGNPAGWIDPDAEWIWSENGGGAPAGDVFFRKAFSTATDQNVKVMATADDAATIYLDGVPIIDFDGPAGFTSMYEETLELVAGQHLIAVEAHNRQAGGPAGLLVSIAEVDGAGQVPLIEETTASQNEIQDVWIEAHDPQPGGLAGTYRLSFGGQQTANLAYNDSSGMIRTRLEALSTVDAVTVTGTAVKGDGPIRVTFVGSHTGESQPLIQISHHTQIRHDREDVIRVQAGGTETREVIDAILRTDGTWLTLGYPANRPGMTPGHIANILLDEAQDRGCFPDVTWDFDRFVDSANDPWPEEVEWATQVSNDSVLTVALRFEDVNVDVHMEPDLTFRMWHIRGVDRTATVSIGVEHASEAASEHEADIINTGLVRTERDWIERPDPSPAVDRWEGFLSLGGVPSAEGAALIADKVYAVFADERIVVPLTWADTVGPSFYADFDLGDLVSALGVDDVTDGDWTLRPSRVLTVSGLETETGEVEWSAEVSQ